MSVRQSSREAYAIITRTGRRFTSCGDVLIYIRAWGPCTRRKIATDLRMETSSVSARVNELLAGAHVWEYPERRPCLISGRNVYWLDVDRDPVQLSLVPSGQDTDGNKEKVLPELR